MSNIDPAAQVALDSLRSQAPTSPDNPAEGTAATPPVPPAVPEAPKVEESKPVSSAFAALARKEKQVQERLRAAKDLERRLNEREEKVKGDEQLFLEGKKDPVQALKKMGWSYEEITKFILNNQQPTPELEAKTMRGEIEELKRQTEAKEQARIKQDQENQQRDYDRKVSEYKGSIRQFVGENAETYELIKLYGQEDLVFATIEQHHAETLKDTGEGKVLTQKEAADLVEGYLEKEVEKAFTGSKKLKTKFLTPAPAPTPTEEAPKPELSPTLSNSMTPTMNPKTKAVTDEERWARAMAALSAG